MWSGENVTSSTEGICFLEEVSSNQVEHSKASKMALYTNIYVTDPYT